MAQTQEPTVQITQSALADLLKTAIEEAKKPFNDPELQRRKERDRARIRKERELAEANIKAVQDACTHLRTDNTSCVAWMQNSDGIVRGVCQHCNKLFVPEMGDEYVRMRRVPTMSPGVIF